MKRLIKIDEKKAKEVQKLLLKAKNNFEIKRINIIVAYLRGAGYNDIIKTGIARGEAISKTLKSYLKDSENFYKTEYKGKIQTDDWKDVENKIENIIKQKEQEGKLVDIKEVQEEYNKKNRNSKILNYNQTWVVVRRRLKYKYQKPYIKDTRRPENAEQILQDRIAEAMEKINKKEIVKHKMFKNKKTKN